MSDELPLTAGPLHTHAPFNSIDIYEIADEIGVNPLDDAFSCRRTSGLQPLVECAYVTTTCAHKQFRYRAVNCSHAHAACPGGPASVIVGLARSEMWVPLMIALGDEGVQRRLRLPLLRRSTTALDAWYSDVTDLTIVLDAFGPESMVLVGTSRGGRIAMDSTLTHPDECVGCSSWYLTSPRFDMPATEKKARCSTRSKSQTRRDQSRTSSRTKHVLVHGANPPSDAGARCVALVDLPDVPGQLCPATARPDFARSNHLPLDGCPRPGTGSGCSWATQTPAGTQAMASAIEPDCQYATLVRVADTAPMLALERPDVIERELLSCLTKLDRSDIVDTEDLMK